MKKAMETKEIKETVETETVEAKETKREIEDRRMIFAINARSLSVKVAKEKKRKRRRENILCSIVGIGLLSVFVLVGTIEMRSEEEVAAKAEKVITREAEAVLLDIDDEGNFVIETPDENLWEITDAPEVYYKVIFDTKGTEDVTDDEIIGLECLE